MLRLVNASWKDKVGILNGEVIAPFIEGEEASDADRACLVLEKFSETGRILMDAVVCDNIRYDSSGSATIVDVDLFIRPDSPVSFKFFNFKTISNNREWGESIWQHRLVNRIEYELESMQTIKVIKKIARLIQTFGNDDIPKEYLSMNVLSHVESHPNKPLTLEEIHTLDAYIENMQNIMSNINGSTCSLL